jgi:hypothetical protein
VPNEHVTILFLTYVLQQESKSWSPAGKRRATLCPRTKKAMIHSIGWYARPSNLDLCRVHILYSKLGHLGIHGLLVDVHCDIKRFHDIIGIMGIGLKM